MTSHLTTAMTQKNPSRILLALLLAATSTAAFAAKSHKSPLPKKPAALLALAAQHNGLASPHLKPWHIKASYQLYDAKGNPTEKGAFQEWWAAPHKYKITFHRAKYHTQFVVNAKRTWVSGKDVIPYAEYLVRRLFVHPVSAKLPADGMKLHFNVEKFGSANLNCVEEIPKGLQPTGHHAITPTFPTYCTEPSSPMLRIFGSYGQSLADLTAVGSLEGRYIPVNATIYDRGKKFITVHLVKGETAANWPPGIFAPPHGAHREPYVPDVTEKDGKVSPGPVISGKYPGYPPKAKKHRKQGAVVLKAIIGQDGRIYSLIVADAPDISLANTALATVKNWKYAPPRFHGQRVNVRFKIHVVFSLSPMEQFGGER